MLDWNDMFLLHMRINAQIVMQDLQKTLTWNDILLQQIKENKPYKCSICDVIFAENMNLKWPISSAHEENKPHKCPICDVIFAVNISLKGHISSEHEK